MTDAIASVERMRDYLADRLPEDDGRDFEARLSREPTLVSELELALRLRAGLSELAERGQLAALIRDPSPPRAWWPSIAIAAAVGVLAVSLWALHTTREPSLNAMLVSQSAPANVSAQYTFRAMRGPAETPVLGLPSTGDIELEVAPVVRGTGARYTMALAQIGADGRRIEVATLSNLPADGRGLVRCYAAASRLTPGTYVLVVSPTGQPVADAETFTFALSRVAPGKTP